MAEGLIFTKDGQRYQIDRYGRVCAWREVDWLSYGVWVALRGME